MLTVMIPTLNEADNLKILLPKIKKYAEEIVIVDDGSTDNTIEICKKHECRILQRTKKGVGSAVIDGIKLAKGNVVAVVDADLSHPVEFLKAYSLINDGLVDIVKGSRFINGGGMEHKKRVIGLRLFNRFLSMSSGVRLHDFTGGFLIAKKSTFNYESMANHGEWIIEYLLNNKNKRIAEVPYIYKFRHKGESKFAGKKDIARLIRYTYYLIKFRFAIKPQA